MHLTEAEIMIAAKFSGDPSMYDVDYANLAQGKEINLQTEGSEYEPSRRFKLTLETVVGGVSQLEDRLGTPPCKLFQATVLESERELVEQGESVFGFFFPDGFAVLVDSAPDGDYTNRRIQAGLVLADAGEL
jgi:hypothetical protein